MSKCKICSSKFAVFHGKKLIFSAVLLYLYDSGIPLPVCIRKQIRYTGFWPVALIYRAAGIPASGGGVDIPCRRYTDFCRRGEIRAKSVYRLLASKWLNLSVSIGSFKLQQLLPRTKTSLVFSETTFRSSIKITGCVQ